MNIDAMQTDSVPPTFEKWRTNGFGSSVCDRIISDIEEERKRPNATRYNTLFYKIVQGGDHEQISEVLSLLRKPENHDNFVWLLGRSISRNQDTGADIAFQKPEKSSTQTLASCIVFLMLAVIYAALSPVFYLFHGIMSGIWTSLFVKCKDPPTLPLALVCRSRSKKMLEIFRKEEIDITQTDSNHNNVFHYLANLSRDDPQGSILMLDLLLEVYRGTNMWTLCNQPNKVGLTPLEMAGKVGSILFMSHILESEGLVKTITLKVREGYTYFKHLKQDFCNKPLVSSSASHSVSDTDMIEASYDITKFECGDLLCNQSLPLQFVSEPDVAKLDANEVEPLVTDSALSCWLQKKIKMYMPLRILSNIFGIVITVLVLRYTILTGGDSNIYPLASLSFQYTTKLATIAAESQMNGTVIDPAQLTIADLFEFCWKEEAYFGGINLQNWCNLEVMKHLYDQCRHMVSPQQMVLDAAIVWKTGTEEEITFFRLLLNIFLAMYLVYDLIMRWAYLWKNFISHRNRYSISGAFHRTMVLKVPGCYLGKQFTVLAFYLFIASSCVQHYYIIQINFVISLDASTSLEYWLNAMEGQYVYVSVISHLTSICLVLRFISLIYTLRLLPALGHFIITTFKMAETLVQFLVVYLIILVGFGCIFYFLLRDPECPSLRLEGYENTLKSSLNTFFLVLGMVNLPEYVSDLATASYVLYLLLSGVVLLNLIIAIMTSVVDEITHQPNKKAIHLQHHLSDALASETFLHLVAFPFVSWLHRRCLRRAGFTVEQMKCHDGEPKCCCNTSYSVAVKRFYRYHRK